MKENFLTTEESPYEVPSLLDTAMEIFEVLQSKAAHMLGKHSHSDVPDVMQELLTRCFIEDRKGTCIDKNKRGYVFSMMRNIVVDQYRRRNIVPMESAGDIDEILESNELIDFGSPTEQIVDSRQELELFAKALKSVTGRSRRALFLRKILGCSQKEIGTRMHISENTVEQHLTKGARRVAETLHNSGVTSTGRLAARSTKIGRKEPA